MTQTNLEQYALSKGMTKSMDDMTEAIKICFLLIVLAILQTQHKSNNYG